MEDVRRIRDNPDSNRAFRVKKQGHRSLLFLFHSRKRIGGGTLQTPAESNPPANLKICGNVPIDRIRQIGTADLKGSGGLIPAVR